MILTTSLRSHGNPACSSAPSDRTAELQTDLVASSPDMLSSDPPGTLTQDIDHHQLSDVRLATFPTTPTPTPFSTPSIAVVPSEQQPTHTLSTFITSRWQPSPTEEYLSEITPAPSLHIMARQDIWRTPLSTHTTIAACFPITIHSGTFYIGTETIVISPQNTAPAVFYPLCISGRPVLGSVPIPDDNISLVPSQRQDWNNWISDDGKFHTSIVPLMYSIAASSATCWLITLIVLGFQRKRSLLYKLCLICSSIFLLVVLLQATSVLSQQFSEGYLDAAEVREALRSSTKINSLNLAFNTILYLGQVQAAMYLFSRQKEKRMVFWLGGSLTIIAQTIWGVSVFHPNPGESSLPAFAYLFQIAMCVLYVCCVSYFAITNHSITLHPSLIFLTILAFIAACSTIIVFVIDLVDVWIVEWTDSMNWVTSLLAIVLVWEWADRVYTMERRNEKDGVLGRQLFESDLMPSFNKYRSTKKLDQEAPSDNDRHTPDGSEPTLTERLPTASTQSPSSSATATNMTRAVMESPFDPYEDKPTYVRYFQKATYPILYMSDLIINFGLSVSRPISSTSNKIKRDVDASPENQQRQPPQQPQSDIPSQVSSHVSIDSAPPLQTFVYAQRKSNRSRT